MNRRTLLISLLTSPMTILSKKTELEEFQNWCKTVTEAIRIEQPYVTAAFDRVAHLTMVWQWDKSPYELRRPYQFAVDFEEWQNSDYIEREVMWRIRYLSVRADDAFPDDAVCKSPEWSNWQQCPATCPYDRGDYCEVIVEEEKK